MMVSRLLRRSGTAVVLIAELIEWQPDLVVQAGVGLFYQEVDAMKEAWPGVRFVGFEPHPEIAASVEKEYPGQLIRAALGKKQETKTLYWPINFKESASLFSGDPDEINAEVPVVRMDDTPIIVQHAQDKKLFWLDCEGAELLVLKGSVEFLEQVDVVNIELTGKPPRSGWPSPMEVNRFLLDHGFVSQYIHTHRCSSGQNDMVYVKPHLFRPEFCSCPLQVEDYWKRFGSVV